MNKTERMKNYVISVLDANDKWMTANEIIEPIRAIDPFGWEGYAGHSHPIFRVLSGMVNKEEPSVYTNKIKRRIRLIGFKDFGCYEYALTGAKAAIRRCINAF